MKVSVNQLVRYYHQRLVARLTAIQEAAEATSRAVDALRGSDGEFPERLDGDTLVTANERLGELHTQLLRYHELASLTRLLTDIRREAENQQPANTPLQA